MSDEVQDGDLFDLIDVPTVAEYKQALKACRDAGGFRDSKSIRLQMLRANYQADDHTLTAGELANRANLSTFSVANNHYGNFAKELCSWLGRKPESRATQSGKPLIWIAILVKFSGGRGSGSGPDEDESIRWTLLPELVTTLKETFFSHLPATSKGTEC